MSPVHVDEALVAKLLIVLSSLALFFAIAVWLLFDWNYADKDEMEPIQFVIPQVAQETDQEFRYEHASNRPLFWPTRMPVQSATVEQSQTSNPVTSEGIKFLGIISSRGQSRVMLSDGETSQWLLEGDVIRDWRVKEIKQSSVVLINGDIDLVLPRTKDNSAVIDISRVN